MSNNEDGRRSGRGGGSHSHPCGHSSSGRGGRGRGSGHSNPAYQNVQLTRQDHPAPFQVQPQQQQMGGFNPQLQLQTSAPPFAFGSGSAPPQQQGFGAFSSFQHQPTNTNQGGFGTFSQPQTQQPAWGAMPFTFAPQPTHGQWPAPTNQPTTAPMDVDDNVPVPVRRKETAKGDAGYHQCQGTVDQGSQGWREEESSHQPPWDVGGHDSKRHRHPREDEHQRMGDRPPQCESPSREPREWRKESARGKGKQRDRDDGSVDSDLVEAS
jgi:hypothetical protein